MMTKSERMLRRSEAAKYVKDTYNMPCSPKSLAKYACIGSDGPPFRLVGRFPLYPISGLDEWVKGKMTRIVRSTSQLAASVSLPESAEDSDRDNLAKAIEPLLYSVCSDRNSDSKQLAKEIADRVMQFVYGPPALRWKLSGDAAKTIDEIEANIRNAKIIGNSLIAGHPRS
jgi:hypothetical protein